MKVVTFAAGLAAGYVLGARAGREKYEQIVETARKVSSHPTVVQAQDKAKAKLGSGASAATSKVSPSTTDTSTTDTSTIDMSSTVASTTGVSTADLADAVADEATVTTGTPAPRTPRPPRRKPSTGATAATEVSTSTPSV